MIDPSLSGLSQSVVLGWPVGLGRPIRSGRVGP